LSAKLVPYLSWENQPSRALDDAGGLHHDDVAEHLVFSLARAYVVGATGFEPVTSSVAAKPWEPLC
jgi:hypothetical protein